MSASSPALSAFVISRLLLVAAAYVGLRWFALPLGAGTWQVFPDALWLDGWIRFDAAWYWSIVDRGYDLGAEGQANVAFFPLFPLLAATLAQPLSLVLDGERAFYAAAVVVANGSFLIALVGLYRLAELRLGRPAAVAAVWLLVSFPFAFFFSAAYTESLYLALTVWAFLMAERDRPAAAGLLAAGCALTRVPGILVMIALLIEHHRHRRPWRQALPMAAAPAALAALLGYFWWHNGDPLAFARVQEHWGRTGLGALWAELRTIGSAAPWDLRLIFVTYLAAAVAAMALAIPVWRRLGPGYAFLVVTSLVLPLSSGIQSMGRYVAVMFPVFVVAGALAGRHRCLVPVAIGFAALQLLYAYWFTNWHLVT